MEAACPGEEPAAHGTHAASAPDDDTLSVGLDMPDLPLDVPPDPDSSVHPASTAEAPRPEEVLPEEEEEEEQGRVEDSTMREELPSPHLCGHQEEGTTPGPPEESSGAGAEEEQRAESALQPEEGGAEAEESQTKTDSGGPEDATDCGAAPKEASTEEGLTSEEPPGEMAPQEEQMSGLSCACQSLLSNYNSNAPSRRKNRPCSLPVSELETVIASACGEPETPRSHYIRIHHLLHSLPSAKHRAPSQEEEEEETGEGDSRSITQDGTSTTLKTSKEEERDDEEDEDTSQSPSQVRWEEPRF